MKVRLVGWASAVNIFKRSVEKNNVRHSTYIGDGDTSSYAAVVASKPYGEDLIPMKDECIVDVQKRVGTRLRRMKTNDKTLGGKGNGKLTDKAINNLQNYMGLAIRQNIGDLNAMKLNIGAILYHYSDADTPDSWCKFQQD